MLYLNRKSGEAVIINHCIEFGWSADLSAGDDAALDRG
jgi:hypothetical protein